MAIVFTELGCELDEQSQYEVDMCALTELGLKHKNEYDKLYKKYYDMILQEEVDALQNMGMKCF